MKDDSVISSRSGQYVRQMEGYRAFLPLPLPPKPPVQITGELQNLLSQADRALGRLDGSIQTLPNPNFFLFMCVRKEAVLSSQIEGTQSSLQDVLEAEAKILVADHPQDADEALNYIEAMNHGLKRLDELPVSVRLIREIHAKLLRHTRGFHLNPGELRTRQNWIGPVGCSLDEAEFVPPPPNEVPVALGKLEAFLHNPGDCPALIWIGMAHAQFETIHPFLDGNGRVGRLLITFLLCEQKILLQPVLYLSSFFKRRRQQYYEKLQSVRDNGAWEEWLAFFLRGIAQISQEATDTARAVLALRENHRRLITDKLGRAAANGHCVLEYLYKHPIVRVSHVRNWIGTTYPAANNLVARMADCGILEEFTGHSRIPRLHSAIPQRHRTAKPQMIIQILATKRIVFQTGFLANFEGNPDIRNPFYKRLTMQHVETNNRSPSLQGFMRRFLCALLLVLPPLNLPAEDPKRTPALSLANVYHDGVDVAQYWVSEKLDGVRAYWDGAALYSRQGNRFHVPAWFVEEFPQTPLDGELWMGRGTFETLSGIVRRKKPDDEDWRNIRFMVFDLPADSADFDGRLCRLKKIFSAIKSPQIGLVEQFRVADSTELKDALQRIVSQGGEGLMLRKADSRYRAGRSDDLLKFKLHEDAEAVVIAHLPGKGKYKGMLGALLVEMPDGKRFKLGSGFSDQERQQPPTIGAIVTYKHYGKTRNGIPRFASFLRIRNAP